MSMLGEAAKSLTWCRQCTEFVKSVFSIVIAFIKLLRDHFTFLLALNTRRLSTVRFTLGAFKATARMPHTTDEKLKTFAWTKSQKRAAEIIFNWKQQFITE